MGRTTHGIALKSHALTPIETLRLQHKNSLGTRPVSTTRANPPQGGDAKPRDLPQGSAGLPKETTERKARRSKAEMPWRGGLVVRVLKQGAEHGQAFRFWRTGFHFGRGDHHDLGRHRNC